MTWRQSDPSSSAGARPVSLVTGGAGAMGLATVRLLAREHRVFVNDVVEDRVAEVVSDLRDAAEIASLLAYCTSEEPGYLSGTAQSPPSVVGRPDRTIPTGLRTHRAQDRAAAEKPTTGPGPREARCSGQPSHVQ